MKTDGLALLACVLAVVLVSGQAAIFPVEPGILYTQELAAQQQVTFTFNVTNLIRHVVIATESLTPFSNAPNLFIGIRFVPDELLYDKQSQGLAVENTISLLAADFLAWEGEWFITIEPSGGTAVNFTFAIGAYECVNNCSGHGVCDVPSGLCACDAQRTGPDCTVEILPVTLPAVLEGDVGPDYDWDVYRLEIPPRYASATRSLYDRRGFACLCFV
jgi:hypothetical protein